MADAQDSDVFLFKNRLRFSVKNRSAELLISVIRRTSWITNCHRAALVCDGKSQHIRQLPLVFRGKDSHIRDHRQIGKVEDPLVCLPVASHESGSVHRKNHRQILKSHIVDDLVISPLKEGRVHCKYWF